MSGVPRTSIQLYRDCLRLIKHIAPGDASPKSVALRTMVRKEFEKSRNVTDPEKIEGLKGNAVRGLSNYMLFNAGPKDGKVKKAMKTYHERSVKETQRQSDNNNKNKIIQPK